MPKTTQKEKEIRRNILMQIENTKVAAKAIKRYYPDGIEEFVSSIFDKLFKAEDEFDVKLHEALKQLKTAREEKNKERVASLKAEVKSLHSTKKEIAGEIKKATHQNTIYYRAAKPYLDAKKLLVQAENYKHL